MAESYQEDDLATLRAIARGQGIADAETMSRVELVDALRTAVAGEPAGSPPEGPQLYHGVGVGRRERVAADAGGGASGEEAAEPE